MCTWHASGGTGPRPHAIALGLEAYTPPARVVVEHGCVFDFRHGKGDEPASTPGAPAGPPTIFSSMQFDPPEIEGHPASPSGALRALAAPPLVLSATMDRTQSYLCLSEPEVSTYSGSAPAAPAVRGPSSPRPVMAAPTEIEPPAGASSVQGLSARFAFDPPLGVLPSRVRVAPSFLSAIVLEPSDMPTMGARAAEPELSSIHFRPSGRDGAPEPSTRQGLPPVYRAPAAQSSSQVFLFAR